MIVEGIGKKAPTPVGIQIMNHEMLAILEESKRQAEYREYRKGGAWAQGIKGDLVLPGVGLLTRDVRPIFCGRLGEYGVVRYVNGRLDDEAVSLDFVLRKRGDGDIDLKAFGLTIQVKTREGERRDSLVRRIDERGRTLRLTAQAFVFCEWGGSDYVQLLGWSWMKDFAGQQPIPSPVGRWQNIAVEDADLSPMRSLVDNLSARRELASCSK